MTQGTAAWQSVEAHAPASEHATQVVTQPLLHVVSWFLHCDLHDWLLPHPPAHVL